MFGLNVSLQVMLAAESTLAWRIFACEALIAKVHRINVYLQVVGTGEFCQIYDHVRIDV